MYIPYLEVIDKYSRLKFDVIEPTEFWCEQNYYGCGEFEVYLPCSNRTISSLQIGNYIKIPNRRNFYVIEKINPSFDEEKGLMLTVTGREAKAILEKRIINAQTQLATDLESILRTLITTYAGSSANPVERKISGLTIGEWHTSTLIEDTQVSYMNLLTFTDELLQTYEHGSYIELIDSNLVYQVYKGIDKSDLIIFSQMFDNLLNSNYVKDERNYKNFAYVGGEGEGSARIYDTVDGANESDIDRCEIFVDAKDISHQYTDAQGEEQELDMTNPADIATYKSWIRGRGLSTLAEHKILETFKGEIDITNSHYVYGTDYNLGDRVTVQDSRMGLYITPRILKYSINNTAKIREEYIEYGE